MTLTSDLVFRIIIYIKFHRLFKLGIPNLVASWDGRVSCTKFLVTVTLTYFLELLCQEDISCII